MGEAKPRFRFLIDENVHVGITALIAGFGHHVYDSREAVAVGAADENVDAMARNDGLIIVSHDRDFRELVGRNVPELGKRRTRRLPLLQLAVVNVRSIARTRQCWSIVEHHLAYAQREGLEIARIVLLEQEIEVRYRLDREIEHVRP